LTDDASDAPKPRRATGAARVGRGLAIALYWTITLWVCLSALVSVVPQVFWPGERAGRLEDLSADACGAPLRALHRDLLEGAAGDLSGLAIPSSNRGRWLEGWDGRYRALEATCSGRPSYDLLLRLRYAIEDDLRWAEGDSTLAHDVVLALDAEDRGN